MLSILVLQKKGIKYTFYIKIQNNQRVNDPTILLFPIFYCHFDLDWKLYNGSPLVKPDLQIYLCGLSSTIKNVNLLLNFQYQDDVHTNLDFLLLLSRCEKTGKWQYYTHILIKQQSERSDRCHLRQGMCFPDCPPSIALRTHVSCH